MPKITCRLFPLVLLLIVLDPGNLLAQVGQEYRLISDLILRECSISGTPIASGEKLAPYGAKFTVVAPSGVDFIIVFYDWYSAEELATGRLGNGDPLNPKWEALAHRYNYDLSRSGEKDRYFLITAGQLSEQAAILTSLLSPTYGALLLPIRYRPQSGLVTKDISLGGIGGVRMHLKEDLSLGLMFGVAITATTLDSASTSGKVLDNQNRASATLPLGVLVQWQRVQFGFFGGLDFLMDGAEEEWVYNAKPWISLGIGLGLFTEDVNLKPGSKATQQDIGR